jgi:hypothetical protein
MRPGAYYVLQDRGAFDSDEPLNEPLTIRPGGGWQLCVTLTRGR